MPIQQPLELTDQQIREKLVARGAEALTDAELLSIVLREGNNKQPAIKLASKILDMFNGNLAQLGQCELSRLRSLEQLGITRAAWVSTALELGRRYQVASMSLHETIECDRDITALFRPLLAHLPHEELWAVYLNRSNKILERVRICQGGVSGLVVDYKLVIKRALEQLASSVVLVHNHPSGTPLPSSADNEMTEKVTRAASLFDMEVMDHVIITQNGSYSFREHGFFDRLAAKL